MYHYPNDNRIGASAPTASEKWAHLEAKSDAMVNDVLAGYGSAIEGRTNNASKSGSRLGAILILGVLALITGTVIVFSAIPPPGATEGQDHVAGSDAPESNVDEVRRFWGPFRP